MYASRCVYIYIYIYIYGQLIRKLYTYPQESWDLKTGGLENPEACFTEWTPSIGGGTWKLLCVLLVIHLTSHVFDNAWHRRNTTAFNQIWSTVYAMNIQDICWIYVVVTVPPPILRWHLWCSKRCGLIRVRWHVQSQIWRYLPGLSICLLHIYKDKMMHHNDHQRLTLETNKAIETNHHFKIGFIRQVDIYIYIYIT